MVGGSSPPQDLRILSAEGRGCNGFNALSRPSFWITAAAKLSGVFRVTSAPKWVDAVYSLITSLQFLRPPVVIMAGFKLRAWIVVRERRTTRAAPSVPGHAPSSPFIDVLKEV
ncbi:hypothetical protein NDU88_004311 [Pleurodeles waltl]|uniref:Uncharacterized protein n=1 Tax=Pleurodeles waltl TaxID=8319 RepID=A0AAV7SIF7_PLEWA|nr:hypothetical protein NDU88_004311 [Pleurodeles waltl]